MLIGKRIARSIVVIVFATLPKMAAAYTTDVARTSSRAALSKALEQAAQCDRRNWDRIVSTLSSGRVTAWQLGFADIQDSEMQTVYELSHGVKIFGFNALKVVAVTAGTDFLWVYSDANINEMTGLAKTLNLSRLRPDASVEEEDVPHVRYFRNISKGLRRKSGDFQGEDRTVELATVLSHGRRRVLIGCSDYSGDPG